MRILISYKRRSTVRSPNTLYGTSDTAIERGRCAPLRCNAERSSNGHRWSKRLRPYGSLVPLDPREGNPFQIRADEIRVGESSRIVWHMTDTLLDPSLAPLTLTPVLVGVDWLEIRDPAGTLQRYRSEAWRSPAGQVYVIVSENNGLSLQNAMPRLETVIEERWYTQGPPLIVIEHYGDKVFREQWDQALDFSNYDQAGIVLPR